MRSRKRYVQSDMLYAAECKDCEQTYVGKTIRHAIVCLKEHGAPKNIFDNNDPIIFLTVGGGG